MLGRRDTTDGFDRLPEDPAYVRRLWLVAIAAVVLVLLFTVFVVWFATSTNFFFIGDPID